MVLQLGVPIAAAALAVIVFVLGDRVRPSEWRQTDDESPGALVVELINTLFLAVAAFVVVICWQQYDNAHNHTVAESKALVDVYWTAHGLPEPDHSKIQGLVKDYTESVVTEEWTTMDRDHKLDQSTQDILDTLRDTVAAVQSPDSDVTDLRASALAGLDAVAQARQDRALDTNLGMPGFLYTALWFTVVLLLFSGVLSGAAVTLRSVLMTGLLGVVVGTAVMAIYNLDRPFSGGNIVSKDAFELALSRYKQIT
jgi:hypothetical protein